MDGLVAECTDQCQTINGLHTAHSIKTDLCRSNTRAAVRIQVSLSVPFVFSITRQTSTPQFQFLGKQVSDRAAFQGERGEKDDILMLFQTLQSAF